MLISKNYEITPSTSRVGDTHFFRLSLVLCCFPPRSCLVSVSARPRLEAVCCCLPQYYFPLHLLSASNTTPFTPENNIASCTTQHYLLLQLLPCLLGTLNSLHQLPSLLYILPKISQFLQVLRSQLQPQGCLPECTIGLLNPPFE